jgi:hypothetical protein
MSLEDLKTIAAFGGLALGLINLFVTIYKDFLRKGKLQLSVETARIRHLGYGRYQYQIDLLMTAAGGDVYLKDLYLCSEEKVFWYPNSEVGQARDIIYKLANHATEEFFSLSSEDFFSRGKEIAEKAFDVRGLKITDKSLLSTTFIDDFTTKQDDSKWTRLPIEGWSILVEYRNTSIRFPFSFQEHSSSVPGGFRY